MTAFAIRHGGCGAGVGAYEAGLLTLPDGTGRGVETIVLMTLREDAPARSDLLGALRGALAGTARLPMPVRLAASTLRAGLGVIEEEIAPERAGIIVEVRFDDRSEIVARMPPGLVAVIRRDRDVVLNALGRSARAPAASAGASCETEPSSHPPALTILTAADAVRGDGGRDAGYAAAGVADAIRASGTTPAEDPTAIFRYEKRNGRLRRVGGPER